MNEAFQTEGKKTLLDQYLKLLNNDSELSDLELKQMEEKKRLQSTKLKTKWV